MTHADSDTFCLLFSWVSGLNVLSTMRLCPKTTTHAQGACEAVWSQGHAGSVRWHT
jgi:hypothetical protein